MRELKHHEKKLLRRVNLYAWKGDSNLRTSKILRTYHIQNREDYTAYDRICGHVTSLSSKLKTLKKDDEFRIEMTKQLLQKNFDLGVIDSKTSLEKCDTITASAFCRRRIAVIMFKSKMCESIKKGVEMVEQGQVRVGPSVVTDPSFLVSRKLEDFVTWVDGSKIKRSVMKYNSKLDDYDLL
ncbi:hypothetical protein TL16_g12019, partial [Triparma laevis f. inornata]